MWIRWQKIGETIDEHLRHLNDRNDEQGIFAEGDRMMPPTAQGLWVAPQPLVGLWVAPTFLHATTRPKQLFIDATVIDTTNTHYTR